MSSIFPQMITPLLYSKPVEVAAYHALLDGLLVLFRYISFEARWGSTKSVGIPCISFKWVFSAAPKAAVLTPFRIECELFPNRAVSKCVFGKYNRKWRQYTTSSAESC